MKNKLLFCVINLLLVILIATVIGTVFNDEIFDNGTSITAYILFHITLTIPGILYVLKKLTSAAINICTGLFVIVECIVDILFMSITKIGARPFAIAQVVVIGLLLVTYMVILFFYVDESDDKDA